MHLKTFDRKSAGKMLAHYSRNIGPRDHIDQNLPSYNLAPTYDRGIHGRFKDLTKDLELGPRSKPLADFVLTLPRDFPVERQREFFEAAYDFLENEVGKENVVCGAVHLDEPKARPHMHFAFVPRIDTPEMTNDKSRPLLWTEKDQAKNPEHVAGTQKTDSKGTPRWERVPRLDDAGNPVLRHTAVASKMFSRARLKEIHPALEAHLCKELGVEKVGILLDDDDERKKYSALDHDDFVKVTAAKAKAEAEAERAKAYAAEAQDRLESVQHREREAKEKGEELTTRVEQGKVETARARDRTRELEGELERERARNRELADGARDLAVEVGELRGHVERLEAVLRRAVAAIRRVPAAMEMARQTLPDGFKQALKSFEAGMRALEMETDHGIEYTEPEQSKEWGLDELMNDIPSEGIYEHGDFGNHGIDLDFDL